MPAQVGTGRVVLRRLSALVLLLAIALSLAAFLTSRGLIEDQEARLLRERGQEVAALLNNSFDSIESSLISLGPVGASDDPAAQPLFDRGAEGLVEGSTVTMGVAVAEDGGFSVVSAVGEGPETGDELSGARAELATRALRLESPQIVADLLADDGGARLSVAVPVAGTRAVAYQESVVNPSQPVPSTPDSPFRELRVALYASPTPDVDQLVLTTDADLPVSGAVEHIPFDVGADQWLLSVAPRDALAGTFARYAPWVFLAAGLVAGMLATAVVETLARRGAYAEGLVDDRTAELRAALDELSETKAFLERLLTSGPVLVIRITVTERRLTHVSANIERLFGINEEDALATRFLESRVHPDEQADLDDARRRLVEGDSHEEVIEYRFRHGDDTYRWCTTTLTPEADDHGNVIALLGYTLDITERRRAQDARREAQEAAETANRAKSEFLSRMSHELRTPLNAVLGFGQLLELDDLTDDQHDAVRHILKGGSHLLDLINEVLDISRIEAGEMSLSPEAVLVSDVIREATDLIRPLADQRDIQLVVDGSGACECYMFADRQRAKQVLLNLLSNAVKYNRPRGTVAVSCVQSSDTRVQITVTDTGAGIPAERLDLLFTPFERLGAEHTGEEGTGIGLALSRRLAEAMGGSLVASSTLGRGSTFTVDLPRVEGPVDRYERLNGGRAPSEPTPGEVIVLHVEDNLSNASLVERVLAQRGGIEVIAAMHGRLGLELARQHHPVLVLLDLHLPDMGGEEVLQRLRDDPETASIPVVIVSADATAGQVQRLLSAGATAYLTKPIDVRELLRLVDETLSD